MLQFVDPRDFDPFTTQGLGGGDDQPFRDVYFSAFPVNWRVQSNVHALLLNEAGRLIYGEAAIEYTLNAYTVTYGEIVIEYILGGIVDAEFTSTLSFAAPFTGSREVAATFTSALTFSSTMAGQVEAEAEFTSTLDFASLFTTQRERTAEFVSTLVFDSDFEPDDIEQETWVFTLGGEAAPASRYTGFYFNSFAVVDGYYYAAGIDGIYELGGEDDDGTAIEAAILTASRPQGGVDRLQGMPRVYLLGRSDGILHCEVTDQDGTVYDYPAERALGTRESRQRVKIGRGLRKSVWPIRIKNEGGQDFELIDVGTLPDVLKKRVG